MVKCLRNDQMTFFWIVLVFRGKQTFKMLHKSRWNVKVYITLTIMTFRSIFKVTRRSRRFFLDWTLCPDKFFLKTWGCGLLSPPPPPQTHPDSVTSLWLVTKKRHFVLTFSVTQKQRRRRSKFCFLWDFWREISRSFQIRSQK